MTSIPHIDVLFYAGVASVDWHTGKRVVDLVRGLFA
jgi:hypothetical protein